MSLPSKMPHIEPSIFPVMSELARAHNAVNLAQGFPGFGADPQLLALIGDYTRKGYNQYAPLKGVLQLREKISKKIAKRGGRVYHPEKEVCITAGATQAIFTAISALVFEGDEVIVVDPAYDCYVPAILLNKGIPVRSELRKVSYEIDWKDIQSKVNEKTRCIIVNTPHNPTGKVWEQSDIDGLRKVVQGTKLFVLADEVYEHIVYNGLPHLSIANEPDLADRAFVFYSFGKTYHMTGWRVGYVCAPANLMAEFVKCHQFQVYAVNTPFQHAVAAYMENEAAYLSLRDFFQEKRDFFLNAIKGSRFKAIAPSGTYFALLDYGRISEERDRDFANRLTIDYKVAAIPVSVFFESKRQDQVLRFCFAKENHELEQAAEALHRL